MSSDHELNEFGLLLDQFHAVVREGSDSIEDMMLSFVAASAN